MELATLTKVLDDLNRKINEEKLERSLQLYIERYPFLICGFRGHIHKDIVISQFPLGNEYKTDFAFVVVNSRNTTLHLVEIESPALKMFTSTHEFSQPYNHALQQVQDWISWCNQNQQYLVHTLMPLELATSHFQIKCKLIAGKRSDLTNTKRKRRYSAKDEQLSKRVEIVTWDGFVQNVPLKRYLGYEVDEIKCVSYRDQDYFDRKVEEAIYGA